MQTPATRAHALFALLLAALSPAAYSIDFTLSGFGTIGGAQTTTDHRALTTDTAISGGARKDFEFIDNRLAVQGDWRLDDRLSFTLQLMSQRSYDNSYRPRTEWAFAKYKLTPDVSLRAGRIYVPSFLATDYAFVGYAQLQARPPTGVYGPRATPGPAEGLDATWQFQLDNTVYTLSGGRAQNRLRFYDGAESHSDDVTWLLGSLEKGHWLVRISHTRGHSSRSHPRVESLADQIQALGQAPGSPYPQAIADAQALRDNLNDVPYRFTGLALTYDDGLWQFQSEWTRLHYGSAVFSAANNTGWYATAGRRYGQWIPYGTYLRNRKDGSSAPIASPGLLQTSASLAANLNAYPAVDQSQHTVGLGIRWDFIKNAAIKLQYERTFVDGTVGMFFTGRPGQYPSGNDRRIDILSAVIDFVF